MAKIDKLLSKAQEHLEPDEEVLKSVLGAYEAEILGQDSVRNGILIATDRRLVFYAKKLTGYELESFSYSNISSLEQGKTMMGHTITFFATGNRVNVKWIKEKDEFMAFMDIVKGQMGKKSDGAPAAESNLDKLKKLGELKDAGVISEEEFAAEKAKLMEDL